MAPKVVVLKLRTTAKVSPQELEAKCTEGVTRGIADVFAAARLCSSTPSAWPSAASSAMSAQESQRLCEMKVHQALPPCFSFVQVADAGKELYHLSKDRMLEAVRQCLLTEVPLCAAAFIETSEQHSADLGSSHVAALHVVAAGYNFTLAALKLTSHLLSHFDNAYCRTHIQSGGVVAIGQSLFIETVAAKYDALVNHAVTGFLEQVGDDREGNVVSRAALSSFRSLAVAMNRYHPHIESALEKQAAAFFTKLGNKIVYEDRLQIEEFVHRCELELAAERHRVACYGHSSTKPLIEAIVQQRLVKAHLPYIAAQGMRQLVQNKSYHVASAFYRLARLDNVKQEDAVKRAFREFVLKTATDVITAPDMDDTLIDILVAHNCLCSDFVSQCFVRPTSDSFNLVKREAFESAVRPKQVKCAELLAKYLDAHLRGAATAASGGGGGGACPDEAATACTGDNAEAIDTVLNRAMELFDYIPSKDIFEAFYARDFGKRLILQRSIGQEHERVVIDRLRLICGPSIAVKLTGMMKDIELSRELVNLFKQTRYVRQLDTDGDPASPGPRRHVDPAVAAVSRQATMELAPQMSEIGPAQSSLGSFDLDGATLPRNDSTPLAPSLAAGSSSVVSMTSCGFEFNPTVLTQGYWPTYPDFAPQLPSHVAHQMGLFKIFYCSKHQSRKLQWQFSLSHCVVRGQFPKARKELIVSFLQALMLLQFNTCDALTYGELLAQLGVEPSEEATCAIIALYAGNAKLLIREKAEGLPPLPAPKPGETRIVVRNEDLIKFNSGFSNRLTKIRVNQVQLKETKAEVQETTEKVLAERHYVVDAAIVRVMKNRKESTHNDLVAGVISMLRFAAQPSDIKKRIEILIERDYLERDTRDPALYRYLA